MQQRADPSETVEPEHSKVLPRWATMIYFTTNLANKPFWGSVAPTSNGKIGISGLNSDARELVDSSRPLAAQIEE